MKAWLPHLATLLIGLGQVALYKAWHLDSNELDRIADVGTTKERIRALHILTNRGSSPHTVRNWDREAIQRMIGDEDNADPLMADFAYTVDICRMVRPVWQDKKISARLKRNETGLFRGETFTDWLRHFLLFRRKVAGRHMGAMLRLKNDELRWLLDAIAHSEDSFSPARRELVLENIHQRQTTANMSRTNRMALPDKEGKKGRREGTNDPSTKGSRLPGGR